MPGSYRIEAAFSPIADPANSAYNIGIGYRGMQVFSPENKLMRVFKSHDPHRDRKDAHASLLGIGNWIEAASVQILCDLWDAEPEERYKRLNAGKL